uniref:Uncharacterized protein n=1 Tax=Candidatus Kentrum sp. FM TaxID=2126340 RepID=A0A450TNG8_9GAMM|nr:MAG: Uncharacterised protein family (UPF0175) [Candidatus Kentron sp. FM]VFJ69329.1 MAG: Uncharacterised protein family (UPF0175) [Candidatus Kentron sp. FM]VFK17682.1 MAG: Uncharacterised protein family (UPF0175) [Candidatus Kentron sp. FM]
MQIVVDVPDRYFPDIPVTELAERLKLSTALLMFRIGQLSAGAACEFAGVDRYTFFTACAQYDIPVIDYDGDELDTELETLKKQIHPSC